jgi:hypothetical protein
MNKKNENWKEEEYQKIRKELYDNYDDPEEDDEDELNRDAEELFQIKFGETYY